MPEPEFYCISRACRLRGRLRAAPWRDCGNAACCPAGGTHYPLCPECGNAMRENVSAPAVVWVGTIGQRYRDRNLPGYHLPDGQWAYTRKTPDGKPKPVFLENWQQVREYAKNEGCADPRELPRNYEVAEDGKGVLNTRGMPGTEV